jgi:ferredoxin
MIIITDNCISCGMCQDACPNDAIVHGIVGGMFIVCDRCKNCGACLKCGCPMDAITQIGAIGKTQTGGR